MTLRSDPPGAPSRGGCELAILFDLDGLLVDSETLYAEAYARAAAAQGFELTATFFQRLVGRSNDEAEAVVAESFGPGLDARRFASAWRRAWQESASRLSAKPGARELLGFLAARGFARAVASSSESAYVDRTLAAAGLASAFPVRACGDEVERAKPSPQVFLLAAERLGVAPDRCLVLEDSHAGLRAARAAAMSAILVPDIVPAPRFTTAPVCRDLTEARGWIVGWSLLAERAQVV